MKRKRFYIIVLALCLSLSAFGNTYAAENESDDEAENLIYPDIEGHWAEDAIEALYETGALNFPKGEPLGTEQPISRAHFLFMLINTKGITPIMNVQQTHFSDVAQDSWYFPYVETAYQLGIISGNENNFFPDAPVTRQEGILMLVRALGEGVKASRYKSAGLDAYKDSGTIAEWAKAPYAYAMDKGYCSDLKTDDRTYLYPNKEITRAEAAALIYKTLYQRLTMDNIQKEDVDGVTVIFFEKITATASAYNKDEKGMSDRTALGWQLRYGLVAVDPSVIPYGTHLYIPGYGFAVAADRGGKGKENQVDLYLNSLDEVKKFGVKKDISVYILDPISETKK